MCWITLTPTKNKKKSTPPDCSSADIVRVHHSPKPRFSDISISLPSTVTSEDHHHHHHEGLHLHPHIPEHLRPHAPLPHGLLHHHHRHPHLHPIHPLHLHPLTPLHGAGKKISFQTPFFPPPLPPTRHSSRPCPRPRPPPPSSSSSTSTSMSSVPCAPREPIYRTQIVEPGAVRASTRSALQDGRVRGRLRRVGGYEVLGKNVPWDWDCVSSTVGSSVRGSNGKKKKQKKKKKGKKKGKGGGSGGGEGLKYPPFGGMERWL